VLGDVCGVPVDEDLVPAALASDVHPDATAKPVPSSESRT